MKVFILDDVEERIIVLSDLLRIMDPIIITASTRDEAIEVLSNDSFDVIFLDHDLGHDVYVDSNDYNTGWWVAKYIADNDIKCDQIIIHTLNYSGAQNMLGVLPEAVHIPFTFLIDSLRKLYAGEIH